MKKENRKLLEERARKAARDLYRNATPVLPDTQNQYEDRLFWQCFNEDCATWIDDVNSGYAPGFEKLRDTFGKVYTWGRSNRTCAPEGVIQKRGGGAFSIDTEWFVGLNAGAITDRILLLERFNREIRVEMDHVPEWWKETKDANDYQPDIEAHEGMRPVQTTVWVPDERV